MVFHRLRGFFFYFDLKKGRIFFDSIVKRKNPWWVWLLPLPIVWWAALLPLPCRRTTLNHWKAFSGWKLVRWNESCGSAGKAFGSDEQSLFHSLDGLFSSVPVFLFPWVRGDRPCGDLQPEKPPPWRRTRFRQVGRCVPNRQEIPG